MENFENLWKHILEEQSGESGWEPDKEQIWKRVETRQKRNRKMIYPYLTHIAAASAGVLLAFSYFLFRNDSKQPVMIVKQQVIAAAKDTLTEVGEVVQPIPVTHAYPLPSRANKRSVPIMDKQVAEPEKQVQKIAANEGALKNKSASEAANEMPSVSSVASRSKPIHLADLEKHNKPVLKQDIIERYLASKISGVPVNPSPGPLDFFRSFSK